MTDELKPTDVEVLATALSAVLVKSIKRDRAHSEPSPEGDDQDAANKRRD